MYAYHGSGLMRSLRPIIKSGIKPRKMMNGRRSTFIASPSHPQAVYLSVAYAPFFACAATRNGGIIVEVDLTKLDHRRFSADEDVVQQTNDADMLDEMTAVRMRARTRYWKGKLFNKAGYGKFDWLESVQQMGTFTHFGKIPAEAITRICIVQRQKMFDLSHCFDASISIQHYRLLGEWYRMKNKWLFDNDSTPVDPLAHIVRVPVKGVSAGYEWPPMNSREGIHVFDMQLLKYWNDQPSRSEEAFPGDPSANLGPLF